MDATTMGRKKVTDGNDAAEESARSLDRALLNKIADAAWMISRVIAR